MRLFGLDKGQENSVQTQIMTLSYKFCLLMQRDAKFLNHLPSQLAAASLMVAINLTQEKKAERSKLNFKYVSAEDLTDIIQESTKCKDIQIGHLVTETDQNFLHYPIVWCQHMEKLTGLNKEGDILPAYLALVMHINT